MKMTKNLKRSIAKRALAIALSLTMVAGAIPGKITGTLQTEAAELASLQAVSLEVAKEGTVLLRNDNQVLPLKGKKVALFGRAQIDTFYKGYGSGGYVASSKFTNVLEYMKKSEEENKIDLNDTLVKKYEDWTKKNPGDVTDTVWKNPITYNKEMELSDSDVSNAAKESDVAVVVIGRRWGEGRDLKLGNEDGQYYLTSKEKDMLKKVNNNFKDIVVVFNTASVMDMKWIADNTYNNVDAYVLGWVSGMQVGRAITEVLVGDTTPSGKLPVTIMDDLMNDETNDNYGQGPKDSNYDNRENYYKEDIYLGYRYTETFGDEHVLFPFGHGLSYTTFETKTNSITVEKGKNIQDDVIKVSTTVTNTGKTYSGKEVVQVYYGAPQGKLGKPSKTLVAYAKTNELAPGASQNITLSFKVGDMASYDETGKTSSDNKSSYVLEAGNYPIYVGNSVKAEQPSCYDGYKVDKLTRTQKLQEAQPVPNDKTFKRIVAKEENGKIVKKEENVPKTTRDLDDRIIDNLPKEIKQKTSGSKFKLIEVYKGNKTIDEFIAQLTTEQVCRLCAGEGGMKDDDGIKGNAGVFGSGDNMDSTFGIPKVSACDGPAGIRWEGSATAIPSAIVIGSTWNDALTEQLCVELGKECLATTQSGNKGVDVLLAPGMNIIRNPRCGRNYEYFSEDPLLTGRMASAYVSGLQSTGVAACVKHYAAFNQGQYNDKLLNSYMSERCLREIYLKPFEICVKESNPYTFMTAYGGVNGEAASGCYDLNVTILRKEWGWDGMVMTDWGPPTSTYKGSRGELTKMAHWVQGGQDLNMPGKDKDEKHLLNSVKDKNGLTLAEAQNAAKNVLNCIMRTPKFARDNKLDFYKYDEPKYEYFTVDTKAVVKPTLDKIYVDGTVIAGFDPSGYDYTLFRNDLTNLPKVTYDVPEGATAKAATSGAVTTITVTKDDQESVYKITFTNQAGLEPTVENPIYAYLDDIAIDGKSLPNFFPTDYNYNVVYKGEIGEAKVTCETPEGVSYKVNVDQSNNKITVRSESEHQAIEYVLNVSKSGEEATATVKEPFKVKEQNTNNCNRMYLADEAYYMYNLGTEDSENDEKGHKNLSNIEVDSYALYNIDVETSGYYQFNMRESSNLAADATYQLDFGVSIDGKTSALWAPVGGTGGWQNWQTLEGNTMYLSKGTHKLKLYFLMTGFNLSWLEFIPKEMVELETRPNRAVGKTAVATYEENTDSYKGLATNAVDGDLSSRWSSSGADGLPQGIQVDLGKTYAIDKTELYFFGDGREYTYDVYLTDSEVIKNGNIQSDATPVLKDQKGTGSGAADSEGTAMTMVKLPDGSAGRYLTVVVKENARNIAALWELRAYGSENTENPAADAKAAIEAIGEVTVAKESLIKAAREAYDKLTDEQKKEISEDVLKTLTDAEAKLEELKASSPASIYEAEDAALTSACVVSEGKTSSNGKYVGELGGNEGGKATFTVNADKAGKYDLDIYYITYYDRDFEVTVNGGEAVTVNCTGNDTDWDTTVMNTTVSVELKAGINTIAIGNTKDAAPNLDMIVLSLKEESGDNGEVATPVEQAKAALQTVVDVAKTYKEADYEADSWTAFAEALEEAEKALEDEEATVETLNDAKAAIIEAQSKLEKAEEDSEELAKAKEALSAAVAEAKKVMDEGQDKYTEETWKVFDKAYADATNPTAILTATTAKLKQLTEALTEAQAALEPKSGDNPVKDNDDGIAAAKDALNAAMIEAKAIYSAGKGANSDDIWNSFKEAYIAANSALKDANATVESLNNAMKVLKDAQSALVQGEVSDEDQEALEKAEQEVEDAVADAKSMIEKGNTGYTSESWAKFESAYKNAANREEILTVEELQALSKALKDAQAALKDAEPKAQNQNIVPTQIPNQVSLINQVTVELEDTTLYYGGNDGKTTTVKVNAPAGVAGNTVAYVSDNEKVAKVDATGKISAVGKGTANITATVTLANGESKAFNLNVTVKKAYIEKVSVKTTVKVGKKVTLKAKAFGSKKKITWKIKSGSKYAKLTSKGKFTAKAKGKVKVVAKSGKISKTFTIRIK